MTKLTDNKWQKIASELARVDGIFDLSILSIEDCKYICRTENYKSLVSKIIRIRKDLNLEQAAKQVDKLKNIAAKVLLMENNN